MIVYLRCDVGTLLRRTRNDAPRPWLSELDAKAFTMDAFMRRDPVFLATAHHVVDADAPLPAVTSDVLTRLSADPV